MPAVKRVFGPKLGVIRVDLAVVTYWVRTGVGMPTPVNTKPVV